MHDDSSTAIMMGLQAMVAYTGRRHRVSPGQYHSTVVAYSLVSYE